MYAYLHLMNEYENLNERTRLIQRAKERLIGCRKMLKVVLFTPQWKHSSTIWRLVGNILYFLLLQIINCFHQSHIWLYIYALCQNSRCLCVIELQQMSIADICENRHHEQWCTCLKPVPYFLHKERKTLTYFDQVWRFCCKFMHFLM